MSMRGPAPIQTYGGAIPQRYTVERIPDAPDAQVAATIARMIQYVNADCQSYPIKHDADLAFTTDPNNVLAGVHSFVRSRLVFKRDEEIAAPYTFGLSRRGDGPNDDCVVEVLKRPVDISFEFAGTGQPIECDCDDFSMYCAALLRARGVDCCFTTVAANSKQPDVFSHVYVVAYWGGRRIPMDCSHGAYAGWQTDNIYRYQEWPIQDTAAWGAVGMAAVLAGLAWWRFNKTGRLF